MTELDPSRKFCFQNAKREEFLPDSIRRTFEDVSLVQEQHSLSCLQQFIRDDLLPQCDRILLQ